MRLAGPLQLAPTYNRKQQSRTDAELSASVVTEPGNRAWKNGFQDAVVVERRTSGTHPCVRCMVENQEQALSARDPITGTFVRTDLGNAERFADEHADRVRYVKAWDRWLIYDGTRWTQDATGRILDFATITVRRIYDAALAVNDIDERHELLKFAMRSENEQRIKAMLKLAAALPGLRAHPDDFDRDGWLMNCRNGTLDLRTGDLRPHDPADLLTKITGTDYVPGAVCPTYDAFIGRIMDGNAELIAFVDRALGCSLAGVVRDKVIFVAHGRGDNGKSIFTTNALQMLGDYGLQLPAESFMAKRNASVPNDIAKLKGARLVVTSETDKGARLDEAKVKLLTGGNVISARHLFKEYFEFTPSHTIWLESNYKPVVSGGDAAIWNRVRLVPFGITVPKDEQIPFDDYLGMLRAEWPGLLARCVRACLLWQREGLGEPEVVRLSTADYREEMDDLGAFVEECLISNGITAQQQTPLKDVFTDYEEWAKSEGIKFTLTKRGLARELRGRGFDVDRGTGNQVMVLGVMRKPQSKIAKEYPPKPDGSAQIIQDVPF